MSPERPTDAEIEEQRRRRQDEARDTLRDELREAVGDEAAERAERRGGLDSALEAGRSRSVVAALDQSRILIAMTLFIALVAGAIIALVSGVWWFVLVALVLHALGTAVIVATSFSLAGRSESPGPGASAALEDRGVRNPDAALDEAVQAAGGHPDAEGGDQGSPVRRGDRSARPQR